MAINEPIHQKMILNLGVLNNMSSSEHMMSKVKTDESSVELQTLLSQ